MVTALWEMRSVAMDAHTSAYRPSNLERKSGYSITTCNYTSGIHNDCSSSRRWRIYVLFGMGWVLGAWKTDLAYDQRQNDFERSAIWV